MNVSFDVLGVSTSLRQQKDGGEQLRRELQCSLMVAHPVLESRPFDGARLNLLGQLKSNINGQKSTKAFVTLSKSLHWSDFYPMTPCTRTFKSRQQADVTFNLGRANSNSRTNLLPFSSINIASEGTRDHALSNRQHVKAHGRVQYSYEVIFYDKSTQVQVVRGYVPIAQPSTIRLTPSHPSEQLTYQLKAPQRSLSRLKSLRHTQSEPFNLYLALQPILGQTIYDKPPTTATNPNTPKSTISVPFTLNLTTTDSSSPPSEIAHLIHAGAALSITAKWHVHRTIGSPPSQHASRSDFDGVSSSSVIKRQTTSTVPPLYQSSANGSEGEAGVYSAMSSVELELPRDVLQPSVDIDGLRIWYELELGVSLEVQDGKQGSSRSTGGLNVETSLRIPVNVVAGLEP